MDKKSARTKSPTGSTKSRRPLRERILEGQLRQAAASVKADAEPMEDFMSPSSRLMDFDPALSEGDLPGSQLDTEDGLSTSSRGSNNSRASILPVSHKRKTGVAMDEATKLANETLLTAKKALEEAGNMKREHKMAALEGLQTLYETCLALSDSRSRHKYNLENERKRNALELVRIERSHNQEMRLLKERLAEEINHTRSETQEVLKETANIMKWLNFETRTPFKEIEEAGKIMKNIETLLKTERPKETKMKGESWENLITAVEKMNSNSNTISNQLDSLRRHLEELNNKYANLPLLQLGNDHPQEQKHASHPETTVIHDQLTEIKQMIKHLLTNNKPTCYNDDDRAREPLPNEVAKNLEEIKETIKEMNEPYKSITSNLKDLKNTINEATDITAELISPIRTQIEELKREIEVSKNLDPITEKAIDTQNLEKRITDRTTTLLNPITLAIEDLKNTTKEKDNNANEDKTKQPDQRPKTYAAAAKMRQASYKIRIESNDKNRTAEDILKTIKKDINVIDLGLNINTVRKITNQKLIIGCNSTEDRDTLKQNLERNKDLKIQPLENKKPLLKIIGITNDLNDTQILEALTKQNKNNITPEDIKETRVVRRTRGRTKETTNVILETTPRIWRKLEGSKVHIGFQILPIIDQSPLIQCFRCLDFGHTAKICTGDLTCGYCAHAHDTRQCSNRNGPPRCIHCPEGSHPSYSAACPQWSKWDRLARDKISYC